MKKTIKKLEKKKTVKKVEKKERHWVRFSMSPAVYKKARKEMREAGLTWQPVLEAQLKNWIAQI